MTTRTPAPDEAARSMAFELGLRDATWILAGLTPPGATLAASPRATTARRARRAGTRRPAASARRGQRSVAMAARIAARRTRRTGSPHEVVVLHGGRYGVRKARQAA